MNIVQVHTQSSKCIPRLSVQNWIRTRVHELVAVDACRSTIRRVSARTPLAEAARRYRHTAPAECSAPPRAWRA